VLRFINRHPYRLKIDLLSYRLILKERERCEHKLFARFSVWRHDDERSLLEGSCPRNSNEALGYPKCGRQHVGDITLSYSLNPPNIFLRGTLARTTRNTVVNTYHLYLLPFTRKHRELNPLNTRALQARGETGYRLCTSNQTCITTQIGPLGEGAIENDYGCASGTASPTLNFKGRPVYRGSDQMCSYFDQRSPIPSTHAPVDTSAVACYLHLIYFHVGTKPMQSRSHAIRHLALRLATPQS
jgi:hypothetical protein